MSTFFGEIIEPNSRSFVTDGEECFIEDRYLIESVNEDCVEKELIPEFLIIACGKILKDFCVTYLIPNSIKVIEKHNIVLKPNDAEKSQKKTFTSTLYQLSNNTLLYVCERMPHLYFAHRLIMKLKPWIEMTKHTIVLTSENMISFKPEGALQPFIRSLHTSACTLTPQAPNLELPNTISGLPAAVMSWCQAFKKSALVYTVYVESTYLDSITAEPLLLLMKASHFSNLIFSSDIKTLQSIAHSAQLQHSNLYL